HLGRVLELLERVPRRAGLREDGEARARVAERPGRRLDLLRPQRALDAPDVVAARCELLCDQVVARRHPVSTSVSRTARKRPYNALQRSASGSGSYTFTLVDARTTSR